MSTNSRWWFLDLVLALVLTVVGGAAAYAGIGGRPQLVLVVPLVVFLPGYVLVSALFPYGGDDSSRSFKAKENDAGYAIGGAVRVALAATLSVAIVPMIAAMADFTPWGVRLHPILYGIVAFTLVVGTIAFIQRLRVPAEERYSPGIPGMLFGSGQRSDGGLTMALNVGIVISFLLLASSVGFAVLHPPQGKAFTEFYVGNTNKVDGNMTTMYQTDLASDGVVTNVHNHEREKTQYTVVAVLQRVEDGKVTDQAQFAQKEVTVAPGKEKQVTLTGDPAFTGDNVRVQLSLYKGSPTGSPYIRIRAWPNSGSAPPNQGGSADQNQGTDSGKETDNSQQTTEQQTTTQQTTQQKTTEQQTTQQTTQRGSTSSTGSQTSSTSSTSSSAGTTTTNRGGASTSSTTTTSDGLFSRSSVPSTGQ